MDANAIITDLGLQPHPEGGWYKETWRAPAGDGERASGTAIFFLLKAGERSHWHRVDATEIWHYHAGDPLKLSIADDQSGIKDITLGPNLSEGQIPQGIVPPHAWQAAEPLGAWTLVGCTVSPGFEFSGFELAPADWVPGN